MNQFRNIVLAAALVLGLGQCQKKADPSPADQLPPATQTGANTFGCLVNGQVWTPKGNNGTSNYSMYYDPTYRKGAFNVAAYRYNSSAANDWQSMLIYSDEFQSPGQYLLNKPSQQEAMFTDFKTGYDFAGHGKNYGRGKLFITRLDKQAGIISGTFDFTLFKPGCDSIKVTQGRFDYKF